MKTLSNLCSSFFLIFVQNHKAEKHLWKWALALSCCIFLLQVKLNLIKWQKPANSNGYVSSKCKRKSAEERVTYAEEPSGGLPFFSSHFKFGIIHFSRVINECSSRGELR
ncbi:hypothetical protein DY000_02010155, partial [Brassica cretica]